MDEDKENNVEKKEKKSDTPFDGYLICVEGTFDDTHQEIMDKITNLGGKFSKSINQSCTHLITTQRNYDDDSSKVKKAKDKDIPIMNINWLKDTYKEKKIFNSKRLRNRRKR